MVVRNIVRIDEEKCNGCGECIVNCPEGALAIVDGKAKVIKESFCDGLGACIGKCPLDAITIERREADEFDEAAVAANMATAKTKKAENSQPAGCPSTTARLRNVLPIVDKPAVMPSSSAGGTTTSSQLRNWPVQLALVADNTSFLREADLLLVADCVPFAMADFHEKLLNGRTLIIACPKLDDAEAYVNKMTSILLYSKPSSLTIAHMEVPCCSGLCNIVKKAIGAVPDDIPVEDITISTNGTVKARNTW
jgi:Pyruvate/2-oxoacid:ferredoxin oxidoreductase delta subunit